jgi:hypothetical protein
MATLQAVPDGQYLKGLADVTARIGQIISKQSDVTADSMQDIVSDIHEGAAERAPIETGTLRGTAYDEVEAQVDQVVGSVHFPEPYAAVQHEHVEFDHPLGGEAKYLEKEMLEKAENMRDQLGAELSKLFGGG